MPAAGNVALGIAVWVPSEIQGSAIQLGLNVSGMVLAGWLTLTVQNSVWRRMDRIRRRRAARPL